MITDYHLSSEYRFMWVFNFFLDRKDVIERIGRENAAALARMGGFIRTTARRSMRSGGVRGIVSRPFEPPRVQTRNGFNIRDFISFGVRQGISGGKSVTLIAGPVGGGGAFVPRLLEFGGSVYRRDRLVRYLPRPFMVPAMRAALEASRVPTFWAPRGRGRRT